MTDDIASYLKQTQAEREIADSENARALAAHEAKEKANIATAQSLLTEVIIPAIGQAVDQLAQYNVHLDVNTKVPEGPKDFHRPGNPFHIAVRDRNGVYSIFRVKPDPQKEQFAWSIHRVHMQQETLVTSGEISFGNVQGSLKVACLAMVKHFYPAPAK